MGPSFDFVLQILRMVVMMIVMMMSMRGEGPSLILKIINNYDEEDFDDGDGDYDDNYDDKV